MKLFKNISLNATSAVGLLAVLIESWFFLTYEGGVVNGIIHYFVFFALFLLVARHASLSRPVVGIFIAIIIYIILTVIMARTMVPFGFGAFLLLSCIALMNDSDKLNVFLLFRWLVVAVSIISLVLYIFVLFNVSVIPYKQVLFYEEDAPFVYRVFIGSIGILDYGMQLRNCGLFNEPGLYGTVLALLLCADGINLRKPSNIVLLLTGLTTLSVAFVINLLAYLAISSYKKIRMLIPLVVVVVIFITVLPRLDIEDEGLLRLLTRLRVEEGGLVGDDRTSDALSSLFSQFMRSDNCLFGLGSDYFETHPGYMSSSYKLWVIEYGIIGCLLMWGTLIVASLKFAKKNDYAIIYIIIFFINVYQRPQIYSLMYFVLLFGGILYIRNTYPLVSNKEVKRSYSQT